MPFRDPQKQREYKKKYYQKNKQAILDRVHQYRIDNIEKIKQHDAERYSKNKEAKIEYQRTHHLMYKYNLTKEQFQKMLEDQDFKCAICKDALDLGRFTHIDHDHLNGKIRDVLCHMCNKGLGHFQDDPEIIASAIRYLEKHAALHG